MSARQLALAAVLLLQLAFVLGNSRCEDSHCLVCNARKGTPCYKCQSGYRLQNDNGNVYCACKDKNCNLCRSNGTCKQCFLGYGLNSQKRCRACSDPNCSNCLANYKKCVECQQGYVVTPRAKCKKCPTGCSTCNTQARCTACNDGYGLKNKQCVKCADANCRTCNNNPAVCTECTPGWGLVKNACKACTDGMCLTCDGNNAYCTECRGNRYYAKNGKCVLG